jgi:uncharacterized membrane protein YgdD (TMEM256/DUF423 family)
MNLSRLYLVSGAIFGFLTVGFGAFGAHALKSILSPYSLNIFHKAVHYQGSHALVLLITGLLLQQRQPASLCWAGGLFIIGILLFSGSLYALALTENHLLGAITPFGGLSFLAGWLFFAIGCWKMEKQK